MRNTRRTSRISANDTRANKLRCHGHEHDGDGPLQVGAPEDVPVARSVVECLLLVLDGVVDDAVFLLEIETLDVAVELFQALHGAFFVASSGMVPRGFRDECPAQDDETDGGPDDAHGEDVVGRVVFVDLLHHQVDDDTADTLPHGREGFHTASDAIGADFHTIDLRRDPVVVSTMLRETQSRSEASQAHWMIPIPAPLQSFPNILRVSHSTSGAVMKQLTQTAGVLAKFRNSRPYERQLNPHGYYPKKTRTTTSQIQAR